MKTQEGKTDEFGEILTTTSPTTNPGRTVLGLNPGSRGVRPVTNSLRYCIDSFFSYKAHANEWSASQLG